MSRRRPHPASPAGASPDDRRFPRAARLRLREDIRRVFRRGKRQKTRHLDVFSIASPASRPRIGLVVPKHGHTIVERNLVRRRMREVARTDVLPRLWECDAHIDLLYRVRSDGYGATYEELREEMNGVVEGLCSHASS